MTVELDHPYEQMAEQIMYAKGLHSIQAAVEHALAATNSSLSQQEKTNGLQGMIQAGFDSGEYEGDIFAEMRVELEQMQKEAVPLVERAA